MKDAATVLSGKNSSITRVRPILWEMLKSVDAGSDLLRALINASPGKENLPRSIRENPGSIVSDCRRLKTVVDEDVVSMTIPSAFEWEVPPPGEFLRWMIQHPELLSPPPNANVSESTKLLRQSFLDPDSAENERVKNQALTNLSHFGSVGSRKKWWAFEGFTYVDCFIETETMVLFIEGKRTEKSSKNVSWFSERNQIARNLECARQSAMSCVKPKAFAVLMIIEAGVNEEYHRRSVEPELLLKSWPHYQGSKKTQDELLRGFLGILTWDQVIDLWSLDPLRYKPETVEVAMDCFFTKTA